MSVRLTGGMAVIGRVVHIGSVFAAAVCLGTCGSIGAPGADAAVRGNTPVATRSAEATAASVLCVATINQYRTTLGLAPYARWAGNEACVDGQSRTDAARGKPHSAFGRCKETAQNECPGWNAGTVGRCLDAMWAEGPGADFHIHGHYANMSSVAYTKVACGSFTTANGKEWSVQDFH